MSFGNDRGGLKSARATGTRVARAFPPPPAIPHHTLLRRIGSGSYGDVWLASNSMGVLRAVKIVYRSCFDNGRPFERESTGIRKFEPISRSHEGLVDILHVGVNDLEGYFFYIMELGDDCVTGREVRPETYSPKTLASEIATRGRLPVQECLELGFALARAAHQLHTYGLVHRDIKPSNIIFVGGVVKLADIGLVAALDETRSYVGTEGFIPPEGPGTPQADVFSLGRVLYEVSTGKDRQYFPELPDTLKSFTDPERFLELNEIILRACKSDPNERYKSAAEMQADLVVLLDGKSVKRLRQLERKLYVAKRAALACLVVLAIGTVVGYPLYRQYQAKTDLRQRQIGSTIAYGNRSLESGDLLASLPYFAEALRLHHEDQSDEAVDRMRLGMILAQCPKLTHLWSEGLESNDGEFSPDGTRVVVAFAHGRAKIYNLQDESSSRLFGQNAYIETAVFSHDGRLVATASDDGTARIYDASTLVEIFKIPHPDRVKSAQFSPDNLKLITACRDGVVRIWNLKTRTLERVIAHGKGLRFANLSHDGKLIATSGEDRVAHIWNAKSGVMLLSLPHPHWVTHISFSPDDSMVVTTCSDHTARVWGPDGRQRFPVLKHEDFVVTAEFSPDGRWVLTACMDGSARLWRVDTLQPIEVNSTLPSGERLSHAAFSPDGRFIITTGVKGTIRIWDLSGGASPATAVTCKASADGERLATLVSGRLSVKDTTTGKPFGMPIQLDKSFTQTKLTSNCKYALASKSSPGVAYQALAIFDLSTGKPLGKTLYFKKPERQFWLSDDGYTLAAEGGRSIDLIDTKSGKLLCPTIVARHAINSTFFDPSGQRLITWGGTTVQVWNVTNGQPCFAPIEFSNLVSSVSLRRDGSQLIGSCWDDQLTACYSQVWDFTTGKPVGPRLMQGDGVLSSCFSPDGSRIGTGSEDFTALIWNSTDGSQMTPPMKHQDRVESIAFSPDCRWMVTSSGDCTARIWDPKTGDPLSPPLRDLSQLKNAMFLSSATRVMTTSVDCSCRIWPIEQDGRPVADISDSAKLLFGSTKSRFGRFASDKAESQEMTWKRLRTKYPTLFATTELDACRWHEFAAEESETNNDWYSAVFHLKCLLAHPDINREGVARLEAATKNLNGKK